MAYPTVTKIYFGSPHHPVKDSPIIGRIILSNQLQLVKDDPLSIPGKLLYPTIYKELSKDKIDESLIVQVTNPILNTSAGGGSKAAYRSRRSRAARTVRKSLRRKRRRRSSKASGNR